MKAFCCLLALSLSYVSLAQVIQPSIASYKFSGLTAYYHPAYMDENGNELEIYVPFNVYAGIGNNFMRHSKLVSALSGDINDQDDILNHPEVFRYSNRVRVEALAFSLLGYYTPDKLYRDWAFNAGIADKINVSALFPGDLMKLMLNGNQPYAGQTLQLKNIFVEALYYREFFAGLSKKIIEKPDFSLSVGGRFKYLTGISSIQSKHSSLEIFTETSGKFINVSSDLGVNTSNINSDFLNPFHINGNGFAGDLGVDIKYKTISLSASVTDIGAIRFKKSIDNLSHNSKIHFEGFNANEGFNGIKDDSIFNELKIERNQNKYTHRLHKRLNVLLSWQSKMDYAILFNRRLVHFSRHRAYFSFSGQLDKFDVNEFSNVASIGYTYNWKDFLEVGPSFNAGGYARLGVGCMTSLKLKWFILGVATSNIFPIVSKWGKGTDISVNTLFAF